MPISHCQIIIPHIYITQTLCRVLPQLSLQFILTHLRSNLTQESFHFANEASEPLKVLSAYRSLPVRFRSQKFTKRCFHCRAAKHCCLSKENDRPCCWVLGSANRVLACNAQHQARAKPRDPCPTHVPNSGSRKTVGHSHFSEETVGWLFPIFPPSHNLIC